MTGLLLVGALDGSRERNGSRSSAGGNGSFQRFQAAFAPVVETLRYRNDLTNLVFAAICGAALARLMLNR
ncbi:MAG: hypothetical protein A3G24_01460 [Betaproteobacteria bacterium RIFCSPLOWO2_12_FULL_62_13]|nr:MAG: hypothetical protein A3G24_01460 [Betaproteobacteria bacterium RIFCSPLOWO2_12_FULL_62_13]